jgi:hypothetical protein
MERYAELTRAERLERARAVLQAEHEQRLSRARAQGEHVKELAGESFQTAKLCLFCLGPLSNGSAVCSDECGNGWFSIVPTTDGSLWE